MKTSAQTAEIQRNNGERDRVQWDEFFDLVNESLDSFAAVKEKTEQMACRLENIGKRHPEVIKRAAALHRCSDFVAYGRDGRLAYVNGCRDRICPSCNRRQARSLLRQLKIVVDSFPKCIKHLDDMSAWNPERLDFYMVTLTVPSVLGEELESTIKKMTRCYTELVRARKINPYLAGNYRGFEFTYNKKTHKFHPHIHALFYMDYKKMHLDHGDCGVHIAREWSRVWGYQYSDYGYGIGSDLKNYDRYYSLPIGEAFDPIEFSAFESQSKDKNIEKIKSWVTYERSNKVLNYSDSCREYDHYLCREVDSYRHLLQVDLHYFDSLNDSAAVLELCKYVTNMTFVNTSVEDDEAFYQLMNAVRSVRLYSFSSSFIEVIRLYEAKKLDIAGNVVSDEEAAETRKLDKMNKLYEFSNLLVFRSRRKYRLIPLPKGQHYVSDGGYGYRLAHVWRFDLDYPKCTYLDPDTTWAWKVKCELEEETRFYDIYKRLQVRYNALLQEKAYQSFLEKLDERNEKKGSEFYEVCGS